MKLVHTCIRLPINCRTLFTVVMIKPKLTIGTKDLFTLSSSRRLCYTDLPQLLEISQHDDPCTVLFPDQPPEVSEGLLVRSYIVKIEDDLFDS